MAREKLVEVVEERSIEAFAQVYAAAQANYNGEGDCSAEVRTPHHTFLRTCLRITRTCCM